MKKIFIIGINTFICITFASSTISNVLSSARNYYVDGGSSSVTVSLTLN